MNALSAPPHRSPSRPPARRAAFARITLNEARLAWRQPTGLIGGVGIPVLLLVILGELPSFRLREASFGGLTLFDAYVPILAVFGIAMIALLGVPLPLTSYRQLGVLRRLSTTPVPRSWVLAAQAVIQTAIALAAVIVIVVGGIAAFGAPAPRSPAGLVVAVALAIGGLFPIGLLVAAVARTANGASVIGRLLFFPLMFFAGLWLPRELMPAVLLDVSNYTPLGAAVQAMQDSMQTGFPPAGPLLVLAGYGLAFGAGARRLFRWE